MRYIISYRPSRAGQWVTWRTPVKDFESALDHVRECLEMNFGNNAYVDVRVKQVKL
jgi:hypothetical protein